MEEKEIRGQVRENVSFSFVRFWQKEEEQELGEGEEVSHPIPNFIT